MMISKKTQIIIISALGAVLVAAVAVLIVIAAGLPKEPETEAPTETGATLSETESSEEPTEPEPTEPEWTEMTDEDPVKITEVLFKNTYSLIDEFGERAPWVEIYNAGESPINLSAYCLSDDPDEPEKWQFPDEVLMPGAYRVVFLTSSCTDSNHTGFKVSKKEGLVLSDTELRRYQLLDPDGDSREDNISYGEQGGKWLYFGVPTPGQENTSHGSETAASSVSFNPQGLFISEVSAAHAPRSGECDWVELHNASAEAIDLSGFTLSKKDEEYGLHNLSGVIQPGGYCVLRVTKDSQVNGDDVVRFGLSEGGEDLYLFDAAGMLVDSFHTGALRAGVSSGRESGSADGGRVFFEEPTPGAANGFSVNGMLPTPMFSVPGGFYPGESALSVRIIGSGEIHYTLDGSMPTKQSPLYSGPLTLSQNTALSAVSFENGNLPSERATATYIFEEMPKLPVVCLSISEGDLAAIFSKEVQIRPTATIIERACYMEYYERDGKLGAASPAGARIAGDGTRVYPQKSICLYFRGGYGRSSVNYPFFEDYDQIEFSSLLLRNGGQDLYRTRMIDTFCSMLGKGMETDYAESRPSVVFINGRYYGIYDLKENQNEQFFADRHGLDGSNMNVIRRNYFLLEGSTDQQSMVYEYAKSHNLSDEAAYQEFLQWVDAEAFIDYIIVRSFIGDDDVYNQKYYNVRDWSGKIRPVLFDLDYGIYSKTANVLPLYFTGDGVPSTNGTLTNMWIPTALRTNPGWCEKFIERCAWAINEKFADALDTFDALVEEIRPEIARNIDRWHTHSSVASWEEEIRKAREILEYRPTQLKNSLKNFFHLSDERMKELFPGG